MKWVKADGGPPPGRSPSRRLWCQKHCCLLTTNLLHPQSDDMVERFNRTVKAMLSMFVAENQDDWDEHLP